jgi:hypothetical protein
MKALNDAMDARFQGMGRRPLPDWWVESGQTNLSWWELTDQEQMINVLARVEEPKLVDLPDNAPKVAPYKFVHLYYPNIDQQAYDKLSDVGTFHILHHFLLPHMVLTTFQNGKP